MAIREERKMKHQPANDTMPSNWRLDDDDDDEENKKQKADLPPSIDWRTRGVVSEVKNQGGCGSCWTFSTTGALDAHLALKAGAWSAPRLSEQQLVDCAGAFDTKGCDGGLPCAPASRRP